MDVLAGKRIRPLTILSQDLAESEPNLSRRPSPSDDGLQALRQALDSVRKYRRLVVGMIAVSVLLAGLAGLLMSPSYTATAQLAVDVRKSGGLDGSTGGDAPGTPAPGAEEAVMDTHLTVLLSDAYLRRLLPTLRTLEDARNSTTGVSPTWTQRVRALSRTAWSGTKAFIFGSRHQQGDGAVLAALKGRLKIGQERRSRIISITVTDHDPLSAAEIANTIARSYVDELARQKQGIETQALNSLAMRSSAIQRELLKAKEELEAGSPAQMSVSQRAALEWRMTTLAQQFEMLLRRRQELTARGLVVEPDVALLANASQPELPSSLHPLLIIPPTAITIALLACMLAVILNRFDRTLHTETEAAEALRIPCTGLIPSIPTSSGSHPLHILKQPGAAYTKAIRSILVSLLAADPLSPRSQRTVLVTSSIPREGKTSLSWSLGVYAAQLGRRTLLLDFGHSLRRSGTETADLSSVLASGRPVAEAVQQIQELGMDYLPAGLSDGTRLRVLANPEISSLLEQLSDTYDFVIIDGPSLQEAPEARLLTRWADHVLLAVRSGSTRREIAQTTLHQFTQTEHRNVNTHFWSVLIQIDAPEQDGSDGDRQIKQASHTLLQRSKAVVTRWMGTRLATDKGGSAWPHPRAPE